MGAFFDASLGTHMVRPFWTTLDYPFTVGFWANLTAVGAVARTMWSCDTVGVVDDLYSISMNSSEQVYAEASSATDSNTNTSVAGTMVAGQWMFCLGRFISQTNRRITTLASDGTIASGSSAVSRVPDNPPSDMAFGAKINNSVPSQYWDGMLAELWIADIDVQPDGAASNSDLVRQLAYGGPFSLPHMAGHLLMYHPFRKALTPDQYDIENEFSFRETIVANHGASLSVHPPLPYWYVRPKQNIRPLVF